jgi:hypothetical protein
MIAFAAYANPGVVSKAGDQLGFEPSLPLTA